MPRGGPPRPGQRPDPNVGRFLIGELIDALPSAVLVAEGSGHLVWANRTFSRMFHGEQADAWRGASMAVLAGPYAREAEGLRLVEAVREGKGEFEAELFTSEGESFPAIIRVEPFGAGLRLVTIDDGRGVLDLRAELTAKAELVAREREILRATVEALADGVLVADDTERIVAANRPAADVLGVPLSNLRGHTVVELPIPGRLRGAWLAFLGSPETETHFTVHLGDADAQGRRCLAVRITRATTPTGVPVGSALVITDISERIDREENRRKATTAALDAMLERISLLRERAAGVSKETCLQAMVRVEEEAVGLEALVRGARTQLVAPLMDHPRPGTTAELGAALEIVRKRVLASRNLDPAQLRIEPVPAGASASIDPQALGLVLEELFDNAVTHGSSPAGAHVSVRSGDRDVSIHVRDHGPGVPPDDLPALFDPRPREGSDDPLLRRTERGLAFCREIVHRYGGRIEAGLPRDGGLEVRVELPSASAPLPGQDLVNDQA